MEDAGVQTNSENIESLTEIMDIFDLSDQDEELGEEEGEWPHRDNLLCMRSTAFKHRFVSEIAIIIDVFDVYIEKPCLIETDAATYSEEKSRHTGKYLTAYIPQGMLIFVSSGWGGNTPNDDIVQKSGVLDKLLPGDLVMTQNGIMRLTDEKKLTGIDLRTARKVLELDMDYKRLFGAIRNIYSIFRSEEIPVEFLSPHANNL
ncbi:hypothetical protein B566_EDAN015358, partial [Ephemera danica]